MAIQDTAPFDRTEFTSSVRDGDDRFVVAFSGELDLAVAADIRACLANPAVLDAPAVQVDLRTVTFLDSSAIGVLVSACKRIRASHGTFSVRCDVGPIRRTLEIAGLIEYLGVQGAA